jgi:hypothetical protein
MYSNFAYLHQALSLEVKLNVCWDLPFVFFFELPTLNATYEKLLTKTVLNGNPLPL